MPLTTLIANSLHLSVSLLQIKSDLTVESSLTSGIFTFLENKAPTSLATLNKG